MTPFMAPQQAVSGHASRNDASKSAPAKTYFFMTGETDPALLARLLMPFAKLGLTPFRIHCSSEHGTGEEMSLELRFAQLPAETCEKLAATCRAIIGVKSVMTVVESN